MVRKSFMLVAGETSGDLLGAELVPKLRDGLTRIEAVPTTDLQPLRTSLEPEFFGAGGPHMARAGVTLAVDMTEHAVVGFWEVLRKYSDFRRLFRQLVQLAIRRQPDVIICIDFSGFNLRFAHAIRRHVRALQGTFGNWRPRLVQYVSPQVWASRPERAQRLAEDFDLLLSVIPFEADWYGKRVPDLRVEFVGHPLVDRYARTRLDVATPPLAGQKPPSMPADPHVVLLPGSRAGELQQHLPVMIEALAQVRAAKPRLRACMVLPNESLQKQIEAYTLPPSLTVHTGNIAAVLCGADLAIASTGTVTLECAYFGIPTLALYKTSWGTYQIGKRLIQVKYLAMPNLLAGEEVIPEFIQDAATPDNLARAALDLMHNPGRCAAVRMKLGKVIQSLGPPGASDRAAAAILALMEKEPRPIRASLRGR